MRDEEDDGAKARWKSDTGVIVVLIVLLGLSSGLTIRLTSISVPSDAAWLSGLIAAISFFALLRKVTEVMVQPTIRMRRVMLYGALLFGILLVALKLIGMATGAGAG